MTHKHNRSKADTAEMILPIEHPKPPIRSARARQVADMFGITRFLPELDEAPLGRQSYQPLEPGQFRALLPRAGEVVLLTGPSGAGKSSMLRALRRMESRKRRWIDLGKLALPDRPLVDCFGDDVTTPTQDVLAALSRVGLAEAWSYLRTPAELSEGQRWRLRLAIVLREIASVQPPPRRLSTLVCDEFAALLDRVTACVVARCLRRAIDEASDHACAVIATSHDDLLRALMPDLVVRCDFSKVVVEKRVPIRTPLHDIAAQNEPTRSLNAPR